MLDLQIGRIRRSLATPVGIVHCKRKGSTEPRSRSWSCAGGAGPVDCAAAGAVICMFFRRHFSVKQIYNEDCMPNLDRITRNPDVMAGKPCLRGMRVTVWADFK